MTTNVKMKIIIYTPTFCTVLAALAQVVACLPLVQRVQGSIPGGAVNFYLKIFKLGLGRVEMYTF